MVFHMEGVVYMTGKARRYFPGNNTPEGFFSYYHYILSQREAEKIWCIKGGPGVGKSTFMKKIGETMLAEGYDVDFLHCSSDNNSLDGIVIRDLKISLIDGTSPHVVDPINPGAVDSIIHLGDFWNEAGIRRNKLELIETNERIGAIFARVYNYLSAAEKMYDNVSSIASQRIKDVEFYKIAARLIGDELANRELSPELGQIKRFFASAITPTGLENYINVLTEGYNKVYILETSIGAGCERIIDLLSESALYRGFDIEAYYCPMKPESKIEHLLIPDLSIAIVTSNSYHKIQLDESKQNVVTIDLKALELQEISQIQADIAQDCEKRMDELLKKAIRYLKEAKKEHDHLETYYIPNMDFTMIETLRREIEDKIKRLG